MEPTLIKKTKTVTTEEVVGVAVPLMKSELHNLLTLARHFPWDLAEERFGLSHVAAAYGALEVAWEALGADDSARRLGMEQTIREAFKALDEEHERRAAADEERGRPADPNTVTLTMNRTEAETLRRILGAAHRAAVEQIGGDRAAHNELLDRMNAEINDRRWNSRTTDFSLVAR